VAFASNYVVALVRSMSGAAFDKFPQDNPTLQDAAFKYRLISEVVPYWNTDPSWVDLAVPTSKALPNPSCAPGVNLYDVRLIFRWPVLPMQHRHSRLVSDPGQCSIHNEDTFFKPPPPVFAYSSIPKLL